MRHQSAVTCNRRLWFCETSFCPDDACLVPAIIAKRLKLGLRAGIVEGRSSAFFSRFPMRLIRLFAIVAGLLVLSAPARAGGIPVESLKKLKAASVYVKANFGLPIPGSKTLPGTGSGFLLRVDGETGFVVTNNHVISPP